MEELVAEEIGVKFMVESWLAKSCELYVVVVEELLLPKSKWLR